MVKFFDFISNNLGHVAPILAAAAFGVSIIFERTSALMFSYPLADSKHFFEKIRDLVLADRLQEALAFCERYRGKPLVQVIKQGLLRAHQPEDLIEEGLQIAVSESTKRVETRTPYLATIANVSTLLGLFGTILGLIQSFEAVSNASPQQRSALLSAGISNAMNATLMGLAVAIPCMVAFSFLINRSNLLAAEIEESAVRIMDIIKQRYYEAEFEPFKKSRE